GVWRLPAILARHARRAHDRVRQVRPFPAAAGGWQLADGPLLRLPGLDAVMPFDIQPSLKGSLLELRPLRSEDFDALFAVAADPLIWEQHPASDRYQQEQFRLFFREALESGGALVAIDAKDARVSGSSRFHRYDGEKRRVEIGW